MVNINGINPVVFNAIPSKTVCEICSYLGYNDLQTVRQVDSRCYGIVNKSFNIEKKSYIFPVVIKLFTECEFDSDQERMNATIRFLQKTPDYKCFKKNIKFTYNLKSDE